MGANRINTTLLDLKSHDAATTLQLSLTVSMALISTRRSHRALPCPSGHSLGAMTLEKLRLVTNKLHGLRLRHRETPPTSELDGEGSPGKGSPLSAAEDQMPVQKERHKSLAVFGTLVSPKLRAAQLSFETALEAIIDIANTRSSMLVAFQKVQQDLGGNANL